MDLYRVRVGEDDYLGTAEEVVQFMARGEGSPSTEPQAYMRAVAERLAAHLGEDTIPVHSATAFIEALADRGILKVSVSGEPSDKRVDPDEALGDGFVSFGRGVDPNDIEY